MGYAGMLTEDLEPRLKACPDLTGFPKTEVIIQKAHRNNFDHQVRQTGVTLVEVETKEQMINAINPKTLAMHFINIQSDRGQVSGPEMIEIAKAHNIYTFNDASADVPRRSACGSTRRRAGTSWPSRAARISVDRRPRAS